MSDEQVCVDLAEALEITVMAGGGGGQGPPGEGVPVGGTTGQHLAKLSNVDFDTGWVAAGGGGTAGTLTTNAPLSGGGSMATNLSLSIAAGSTTTAGAVRLATIAESTAQASSAVAVTPAGLANRVPTSRSVLGTAPITSTGSLASDVTIAITNFAGSAPGAVPTSPGGTTDFLRADGTWAAPASSSVSIAGLPPGSTLDVFQTSAGVWPARPTARTDLRVNWIGYPGNTTPPVTGVVTLVDSYTFRS
jgi:hypothetical protein